jgi:hypothetical protein
VRFRQHPASDHDRRRRRARRSRWRLEIEAEAIVGCREPSSDAPTRRNRPVIASSARARPKPPTTPHHGVENENRPEGRFSCSMSGRGGGIESMTTSPQASPIASAGGCDFGLCSDAFYSSARRPGLCAPIATATLPARPGRPGRAGCMGGIAYPGAEPGLTKPDCLRVRDRPRPRSPG